MRGSHLTRDISKLFEWNEVSTTSLDADRPKRPGGRFKVGPVASTPQKSITEFKIYRLHRQDWFLGNFNFVLKEF